MTLLVFYCYWEWFLQIIIFVSYFLIVFYFIWAFDFFHKFYNSRWLRASPRDYVKQIWCLKKLISTAREAKNADARAKPNRQFNAPLCLQPTSVRDRHCHCRWNIGHGRRLRPIPHPSIPSGPGAVHFLPQISSAAAVDSSHAPFACRYLCLCVELHRPGADVVEGTMAW